jgi:hypothetical protein
MVAAMWQQCGSNVAAMWQHVATTENAWYKKGTSMVVAGC